jgi:selenium donor protein
VLVHTDAAQSVGKLPVDVRELGVDFLSLAGHKLYAPKGVGALYVRSGLRLPSLIHGGGHESGRRAGTESNHDVVGLGRAAELAAERLASFGRESRALRDRLRRRLEERLGPLRINGDPEAGLPNTLSVCFRGVDASALLAEIADRVAASAGAACHAEGVDLSSVLEAMRIPLEEAMGAVRFSVGRGTSAEDIDAAAALVAEAAARMRRSEAPAAVASDGDEVRLTRFTHGMGCACKLRPQDLERVLRALPRAVSPDVLVGTETSDDAAVYRLTPDLAVVQTVDFFTPICDDPREFGAISAANSLSDIYAMGAEPRFALSVVGFPTRRLPLSVLERILEGAALVAAEAGIDIVGGHSVEDPEPKFGLVVTGVVHPDRILRNAGALPGDRLYLTKPLGSGIVATAAKQGLAPPAVLSAALAGMRRLNRSAAEAIRASGGAHACTDVTGFGLLGHLRELAAASGVDVELEVAQVPILEGARELAVAGAVPGGSRDNLAHVSPWVVWGDGVSEVDRLLLADAQTSGGLLAAVAPEAVGALEAAFREHGVEAACIGRVRSAGQGRLWCRRA